MPPYPQHRVVALVNPPQAPFELACAAEVFGTPRPDLPARYAFGVCAERPGAIATLGGYDMLVTAGLEALATAGTVVVPGWRPAAATPASAEVIDALREAHRRGARVLAICSGAFVLAQAGLLDGRAATTHWRLADQLAAAYPRVRVEPDVLYVDHGDVGTSAGTAAGIDLCLHVLRSDHGAAYAAEVARRMVMPPHREGGQLQYVSRPLPRRDGDALAPLLDWAAGRLDEPLSLAVLAARAGVSSRTLARRFREQTGTSPGQWLLAQRLAAARTLLEETDLPVEAVAARVGLSSATNLRRRFGQALRTTPGAYRRAFATSPDGPSSGAPRGTGGR